jgi:sec-independent protein translocase protein TatC
MAVAAVRRLGHEQRVGLVSHLDELRGRLIVSLLAVVVAFGVCMWQNHALLRFVNRPLAQQTRKQERAGHGALGAAYQVQQGARSVAEQLQRVTSALQSPGSGASGATRSTLRTVQPVLRRDVASLSAAPAANRPVTLGIGEPFTTTVGVAFVFALILALPVLLYQLYEFAIPAVAPERRRHVRPLLAATPLLFCAGVAFGYLVVLPAAVRFLQGFNSEQFDALVQASQYYRFAATILLAMGLVFQIPVAVLAAVRAGIVTPSQLARNRRYALLACGGLAALLPGDAVTLLLETAPLYLLFELSVLLARVLERRRP